MNTPPTPHPEPLAPDAQPNAHGLPAPVCASMNWGLATDFRYVVPLQQRAAPADTVGVLIQWRSSEAAEIGAALAVRHGIAVPDIFLSTSQRPARRFWAIDVPKPLVRPLIAALADHTHDIALAASAGPRSEPQVCKPPVQTEDEVLVAVLDDGCAFFNERFVVPDKTGQLRLTRVLNLWDQNAEAAGTPPLAGYGGQWSQNDLNDIIVQQDFHQALVYRRAGLSSLRRAASHGTHVMDLLAGGAAWPIVFVQFPQAQIDDPSGVWLERFALDGLLYVLACAGAKTRKIVVNVSWGPQHGPHDGSSFLEAAIDALVEEQRTCFGRELIITVPAGNSRDRQAHAQVPYAAGGSVQWLLPPDGRSAAFMELWWPAGVPREAAAHRIVMPDGAAFTVPIHDQTFDRWQANWSARGGSTGLRITVNPTEGPAASRGLHGSWTLHFPAGVNVGGSAGAAAKAGHIHVVVARADHNMGARRRAKASRLTDAAFERSRFRPADQRDLEAPGSAIRAAGTLNGMATGASTWVAAGYRFSDGRCPPYSSAGPSRGTRQGPDFACVTAVSPAIAGTRASGTRSGSTVRLVGTSTAAPQLARQLARGALNPTRASPEPAQRIGAGCLMPDPGVVHRQ